jgi:BRO family, N-terminal domain
MTKETALKLFEQKQVRSLWNEDEEKWYFSIVDVVAVLTDSVNPTDYLKKIRKRDPELGSYIGTNCPQVGMLTNGKKRNILAGETSSIFRIIQSIPSPKAEPFKLWLAKVGSERLDEIADPEKGIDRLMETYLKKGYSKQWVNQRLKSIEVRKELTDEWENRGVKKGQEYAILTDEITKAWSGLSVKEYKNLKDLKKENLRDNMSNLELVLNMLAEATTTEISKEKRPKTFIENKKVANQGGTIAGNTRKEIEEKTGKKIVSSASAKKLLDNNKKE